ncbi:macrophage-expressed gene 1 protein-like [Tachyglossus aculeatus]|uniref:macrophage-expressed gene 1 protein-like n=1 Tax=Tachyglossus aculeatus TaxID=9261 RepID=UPI0018F6EB50|nr:macrophage-expressed gene 1 protein-like [Tachyglossus aculeatus]
MAGFPGMALFLGVLLVALGAVGWAVGGSGFQACQGARPLPVLEVLPGGGWDNLRNTEMGTVMSLNYSQCRTTEDGEYLIPDQVDVVPRRASAVETHSALIEDWLAYVDAFSAAINADVSFLSVLNGKFSAGCQETKTHNVYDQTVTARVQVRHHIYSVKLQPSFSFHPAFRRQVLDIGSHLENSQSQAAAYLAELLVFNYGTHVLTTLEAGASLLQEDQVKRSFVRDQVDQRAEVTASASATFFSRVDVGEGASVSHGDQLTQEYTKNTVDSRIQSHGSVPFYPGITLRKWQEGIPNRLVAIGKSGLPLPFFIQPEALPELPAPTVRRVAAAVQDAIWLYYSVNTHPGCVRPAAPNFNFQANVDDGSCREPATNFTFGGVFQECRPLSGEDGERLCLDFRTRNPLTGAFSCPRGFEPVLLRSEERTAAAPRTECRQQCQKCWLVFQCCRTLCGTLYSPSTVQLRAYWCASGSAGVAPGLLFGGLYSPGSENPRTKSHICPSFFYPLTLFHDLKVCVSSDYEMGAASAVPFGGFFSCQAGNPLAGPREGQSPGLLQDVFHRGRPADHPMKCPGGYSQHRAYLSDGCQILYCLQAGTLFAQRLPTVKLPPFHHPPLLNASLEQTVLVESDGSQAWVRLQGTNRWRPANASSVTELTRLLEARPASGPSGGAVAGLTVAVTVVLAVAIMGVIYRVKRSKIRAGYQEVDCGRLSVEAERYGATVDSPGDGSSPA